MGVLANSNKQLIYIYSEDSDLGKRVLPFAKSSKKPLRVININKEEISSTIWAEIADMLNTSLQDLFSLNRINFNYYRNNSEYGTTDWVKIIKHNPSLLQHPIVINGSKAKLIKSRLDFMDFYEADGANFDKNPRVIKDAKHTDSTKNENF